MTKKTSKKRRQHGGGFDIQKLIGKTRIEFHWLPIHGSWYKVGKAFETRRSGRQSIRQDYQTARYRLRSRQEPDKCKVDEKIAKAIDKLPRSKSMTEPIMKRIMQAKEKLKL